MNRQTVCDVLNSLEVVERDLGDMPYILVENSEEIRQKLNSVGITNELIDKVVSDDTFCILALALQEGYADEYSKEKGFFIWEPIVDDELRQRVFKGEGTSTDAERLLEALDSKLQFANEEEQIGCWTLSPKMLNEIEEKVSAYEETLSLEGIELVLLAHYGLQLPELKEN